MKVVNISIKQFEKYIEKSQYKNYYQTREYADVIRHFGYKVEFIGIINEEKNIIGASLIMYKYVFMNNKIGYSPRGILFNYENKESVKEMTKELIKFLNKKKYMFYRMDPYITRTIRNTDGEIMNVNNSAEAIIKNIIESGFKHKGETLYFEGENPRWEALVILKNDIRDIFAKLDKRTRNKIRKATSLGIDVIKDDTKDVSKLYEMLDPKERKQIEFYEEIIKKYKDSAEVYYATINSEIFGINSRKIYEEELNKNEKLALELQNNVNDNELTTKKMQSDKLLSQYKNNMIASTNILKENPQGLKVAGAIVIKYDNAAFIFADGYSKSLPNINANYLLKWKLIEKFNDEGLKYLNLNGVSGNFDSETNIYKGLNESKFGYNPMITEYIGEFDIIVNNFNYSLYLNLNKKK